MHYAEFDPAPSLAAHVSCYWGMTVGDDVPRDHPHQLLPDGCIVIACRRAARGELRDGDQSAGVGLFTQRAAVGATFWCRGRAHAKAIRPNPSSAFGVRTPDRANA